MMLLADILHARCDAAFTIKMHGEECACLLADMALDERIVHLERFQLRLDENRSEAHACDGKDGGDIRVGSHQHFVSWLHSPQYHFSLQHQFKGIQTIAAADAVASTDVFGIMALKVVDVLALQIPSAAHHLGDGMLDILLVRRIDVFQTQVFDFFHFSSSFYSVKFDELLCKR